MYLYSHKVKNKQIVTDEHYHRAKMTSERFCSPCFCQTLIVMYYYFPFLLFSSCKEKKHVELFIYMFYFILKK